MSTDDILRIKNLVKNALNENRSKEEIISTFKEAGIINENGDLRFPYKDIYIPSR